MRFEVMNLDQLRRHAAAVANALRPGDVILLSGEVGVGKTSFVRLVIATLFQKTIEVCSPSFTLIQPYHPPGMDAQLLHIDLYRLDSEEAVYHLGLDEHIGHDILMIEWPDLARNFLGDNVLEIVFTFNNGEGRELHYVANQEWFSRLRLPKDESLI